MSGGYFESTGELLCLIPDCGWRYTLDRNQGLDRMDSMRIANTILSRHHENAHPNHQLQVQKCPLRGCVWEERAWSVPGEQYNADRVRLQRKWSKHMTTDHPTVRGPGTIQVTAALFPYGVPSSDNRVIANGAVIWMPEGGVPIVNGRGEPVGRAVEATIQDGWMHVEGFLREDLISELDRTSLWGGDTIPVHFAIREAETTIEDDKLVTTKGTLTGVHVSDHDVTVWEGTGMKALHPHVEEEPPVEGETRSVAPSAIDELAVKAAMESLETALRPLQDAMEAWAQVLTPAIQALAEALAEHAKAVAVKPEPMVIKVEDIHPDFLRTVPADPATRRILDQAAELAPGARSPEYWKNLYGNVPTAPEGPEDWPRLPRDGKRAPTGCEVCEAPVDGRHPQGCPGA